MPNFLAVDGGGTKTDFLLDVGGRRYEEKTSTIHLNQVSREDFSANVSQTIDNLCKQADIKISDIDFTFLAIPGYGQFPENEKFMEKYFDKLLGHDKYKMGNDCVNGWAGSLNAKPGINLVLGTGSIAFGVDNSGNSSRSGGWGPAVGDEASGHYIGKAILNSFTKMSDGRLEKTYIYDLVREEFDLNNDIEIIDIVENMKRDEIASVGKLLTLALEKEDKEAKKILDRVGKEAALIIDSLIKRLDFTSPVKVSYSGGVYKIGKSLLDSIKSNVKGEVEIVKPQKSPIEGSLILAKRYYEKGAMIWF